MMTGAAISAHEVWHIIYIWAYPLGKEIGHEDKQGQCYGFGGHQKKVAGMKEGV
jgi:hypothetical protein